MSGFAAHEDWRAHQPFATLIAGSLAPVGGRAADQCAADVRRFVAIYEQHYRRIASHIYRRLGERDHTEELTAEVFLRAFRNRSHFRGDVPVVSWLLGIATNIVCRFLRRRLLERRAQQLLGPLSAKHSEPDCSADASDELRRTRAAIDELPMTQQAVVSLHCLDGVALKEAARMLGIAEGTAKSRLSRARQALRQALAGGHRDG